jgi:hypothetical protein
MIPDRKKGRFGKKSPQEAIYNLPFTMYNLSN